MNETSCEACRSKPVESELESDDPEQPYRVCHQCAHRLESLSLRPLEWFNLAAIHSPWKYLLHDDFYDDKGVAEQPREDVESPQEYPAPTLNDVRHDLERLIDYAMTRHYLRTDVSKALRAHNKEQILRSLRKRVSLQRNHAIEGTAFEICATVLGSVADEWIRERWEEYSPESLVSLAEATAGCLPFEEGFQRVMDALKGMPPEDLAECSIALAWFRSDRTLDWLEEQTNHMLNRWRHVPESWGQLAALSNLSWMRVVKWLDQGRPLSIVTLDALKDLHRYNTGLLKKMKPKLVDPAPIEEMEAKLREYAAKDPVPRVERDVDIIIDMLRSH